MASPYRRVVPSILVLSSSQSFLIFRASTYERRRDGRRSPTLNIDDGRLKLLGGGLESIEPGARTQEWVGLLHSFSPALPLLGPLGLTPVLVLWQLIPIRWRWYYRLSNSPVAWTLYGLITSQVGDLVSPIAVPGQGTTTVK
ncbi:ABC transporter G family member 39 [Nymphaea thermarum]|nr:ABC transporter G family member 39 [Nymphaea thermarum]